MESFEPNCALRRVGLTLVAAACVVGSGLASAALSPTDGDGDADMTAAVASNPASVTQSTAALPTLISYTVTLTHYANSPTETLTDIGFSVTTTVTGSAEAATFQSAPANCSGVGSTTLTCGPLGSLTGAGANAAFAVTVKAPTTGSQVQVSVNSVSYTEDNASQTIASTASAVTALTVPNPLAISTYVPPAGGTFYTGTNGGIPTSAPQSTWAATVTVPPSGGTTGSITNTIGVPGCPQAANLLDCSGSVITVPGEYPNLLTFVLRRDASTIRGNHKIKGAIVYYDNPSHPDPRINYGGFAFQVPACTDTTYGPLPQSGIPCISQRISVRKDKDGNVHSAKAGEKDDDDSKGKLLYWEFDILAVDNGRYTN